MRTLVVVPTYVEAQNITELLARVRAAVPHADLLVVDDNSPDGTADVAEEVAQRLGQIEVLRRPTKSGLGSAYRAGFSIGIDRGYEVLVQMDADLSHDPDALRGLLAALDSGADVAIGSRYVPGGQIPHWPVHRRALSRYGNLYASFALETGVADATSGFRAYRADALKAADFRTTRAKGYGFQIELAHRLSRLGARIVEAPIVFTDRVRGTSKMSWGIFAEELLLVTWWGVQQRARRWRATRMDGR